jgi:hypothetical protein
MTAVLIWAAFALALSASRKGARAYGRTLRARLAAERLEMAEVASWIQKVRNV